MTSNGIAATLLIGLGTFVGACIVALPIGWRLSVISGRLADANAQITTLGVQLDSAQSAARLCNERVNELKLLASERARAANEARKRADEAAKSLEKRADTILGTPFAYPNDPCASAEDQLRRWLNAN